MTLPNDYCRCHDDGCTHRKICARYLERNSGVDCTSHCASLFPYDISLSDPCPAFIEVKNDSRG